MRRLDSPALKTQFLQHLVEGRLALQICRASRPKKLLRVRDRALPSGPVDFPPPRRRQSGAVLHHHRIIIPLEAALYGAQFFIAGAATDDGVRFRSRRAVRRAYQTRSARIVPPKIRNASPHKETSIAKSVASRGIGAPCTLRGVIHTTISDLGALKTVGDEIRQPSKNISVDDKVQRLVIAVRVASCIG